MDIIIIYLTTFPTVGYSSHFHVLAFINNAVGSIFAYTYLCISCIISVCCFLGVAVYGS